MLQGGVLSGGPAAVAFHAHPHSGKDVVLPEELDLADAVTATVESLSVATDVTVDVDIPAGLTIHAERPRFRRALGNLVLNAMTHGGGSVSIVVESSGDDVLIHVCDEGPGIDADLRDSAFDRFVRGDPARKR